MTSTAATVSLQMTRGRGAPLVERFECVEQLEELEEDLPTDGHRPLHPDARRPQLAALRLHAVGHEGVIPQQVRPHL